MSSDSDEFFPDEDLLFKMLSSDWDCDDCIPPPPLFDLPPPPRPPWLEDIEDCESNPSQSQILDQLETCDNTVILGSNFEETFHSVAVIVVCSFVIVIMLMIAGIVLFRRRKSLLHYHHSSSSADNTMIPSSSTISAGGNNHGQQQSDMMFDQQQQLYYHHLNSIKRAATSVRRSGHFPQNLSLPNHYIPDSDKQRLTAAGATIRQQFRLAERPRNVMELSNQPPADPLYHNYPHIIIGGQPFYLIPTDPNQTLETDSYAYPQNVPIYEEIDQSLVQNQCQSECCSSSVASDQGEIGSLNRNVQDQFRSSVEDPRPRVMVNPLVRDVAFSGRRNNLNSFSDNSYESSNSSHVSTKPRLKSNPVKVAHRSPGNSSSSSIYYYSDTLRKKSSPPSLRQSTNTKSSDCSSSSSDSGLSLRNQHHLESKNPIVETKIVLADPEIKRKDSTQV